MKEGEKGNDTGKVVATAVAIIILAILGQFFVSCSPRHFAHTESEHSVDTVIRERIVHDTVSIPIPKQVERVIVRDSVSHLENDYAMSDASIDSLGYLHHSLETIPHTIYVPVEVPVHDTTVVTKDAETIIKEVEVEKKLSPFKKFFVWFGEISAAIAIAYAVWKFSK